MGARLGRYDVVRALAKGALTDLLLGRADGIEGFQRHVAIKRLREEHARDPSCLEAFINEARLAAALHHHNIVQVLDIGDGGGEPFFAMEYVHGIDIRRLLAKLAKRSEQLPLPHVVSIIASAAAALHHAHEQRGADGKGLGIVHRQVTPGNILVGFDGNVKLVDFGIAKAAIKRSETGVGVLKGSAPYMAPEQAAGQLVDRRSDVFALGIVLYELSTVRRLFKGANEFLTMSAVVHAEVPRPSQYRRDIPSELELIMLKALAREPLDRFQSAGDMADALDKVARIVGVGASTSQLAAYMKLQFGEQKEPWLDDTHHEVTDVDFDGAASGLAPPPDEAVKSLSIPKTVDAATGSPIARARSNIAPPSPWKPTMPVTSASPATSATSTTSATPAPAPRTSGATRPPPMAPAAPPFAAKPAAHAANKPPPPTDGVSEADATVDDAGGDPQPPPQRTNVATPPPPPPGVRHEDLTAIVEPLSVIAARAQTAAGGGHRGKTLALVMLLGVAVVAAAVALWPSDDLGPRPAALAENSASVAANEPEVAPPATPATPAIDDMVTAPADAGVAAEEPARVPLPDEAVNPEPPHEPAIDKVAVAEELPPAKAVAAVRPARKVTKRVIVKPKPKRAAPKKPTSTKQTKPKWNPDDLFLGE